MAEVVFESVTKQFANGFVGVRNLDLEVADGELLVVVGPSGCGKTTTLRMLAGLEDVTDGTLRIGDRVVNELTAKERDIAMVFQSYALYPHLTVADNIGYPLRMAKLPKKQRAEQVKAVAKLLRLEELLDRKPRQLSGGQRQRVAMGRAIVRKPQVFLMDEPLSNLDAKLRVLMRSEVSELQQELGTTMFYVTHDQVEAMTMGHRVAIMDQGELQQVDAPAELYRNPANLFVAGFIGSPPMNLFTGVVSTDDGEPRISSGTASFVPTTGVDGNHDAVFAAASSLPSVTFGVRPEHIALGSPEGPGARGIVRLVEMLGSEWLVHVEVEGMELQQIEASDDEESGPATRRMLVKLHDGAAVPVVAERVGLEFDAARTYAFDGETGAALVPVPA